MVMTTKILFVCISHTLTEDQKLGWSGITLVSDTLKKQTSQVPATATLQEVKTLAASVVAEAATSGCTHIMCAGEPTLVLHVALIASAAGIIPVQSTTERVTVETQQPDGVVVKTATFKHVQWREML